MLSGVRVLDLSGGPGGLVGRILSDLRADVVKVEPPGGDRSARRGPYLHDIEDPERSLSWLVLQAGKRAITFDGTVPAARWARAQLFAWADVLIESFSPPARTDWGLEAERMAVEHPRLVHCSITPFGRSGPYADFRGGDLIAVAMGGGAARAGGPDSPPVRCTVPLAVLRAGPEAALGIVMALHAQAATGRGRLVDVSIQECIAHGTLSAARDGWAPSMSRHDAAVLAADPRLRARDVFTTLELPACDAAIELPGAFARSTGDPIGVRRRAPRIGEHQDEVFAAAGIGRAECEKLAAEGAI